MQEYVSNYVKSFYKLKINLKMSHIVKRGSYKKYLYDSKFKMPRSTQTLINSKKKKLESELLKQKQSTNAQLIPTSSHSNDQHFQSNPSIDDQTNSNELEPVDNHLVNSQEQINQSNETASNQ
jgi:hypothetical protein